MVTRVKVEKNWRLNLARQATKGLAAEFGPHKIRVNSVCPLLGGTGL